MQDIDTSWHEDNIRQDSRPSQLKITDIGTAVLGWENCAIDEGLRLAHREVACQCILSLDRDHNAALNVFKRAGRVRESERSGLPQAWLRSSRL